MHRIIALALLLPLSGHAQILSVDYEAVIYQAGDNPAGYRVGDKIGGRLLVDLLLAPPEVSPGRSELASYFYLPWEPQRDWVTGHTEPGGVAADRIFVTNDQLDGDWFSIGDRRDERGDAFRGIEMTVGGLQMFDTNVLGNLDRFTVTPADQPATFAGSITWGWGETAQWVLFSLKRFTLRPGRCVAPS